MTATLAAEQAGNTDGGIMAVLIKEEGGGESSIVSAAALEEAVAEAAAEQVFVKLNEELVLKSVFLPVLPLPLLLEDVLVVSLALSAQCSSCTARLEWVRACFDRIILFRGPPRHWSRRSRTRSSACSAVQSLV